MARRVQEDTGIDPRGWMLTFSDMVTLLLTFFVMIISITSVDPMITSEISGQDLAETTIIQAGPDVLGFANPQLLASLAEAIETPPPDASLDDEEIKAAVFGLDPTRSTDFERLEREISDSISIFRDERGLVIRWSENVLFPEGTAILREENLPLLDRLARLLATLSLPVSLECHVNPLSDLEGGDGPEGYDLSARRARVVLDHLASLGLPQRRFRLGAFGGARPLTSVPEDGGENSRLEIILYTPPKPSWKG
jgi:chemotaxis protein MotB